jgi:hypothetical protein
MVAVGVNIGNADRNNAATEAALGEAAEVPKKIPLAAGKVVPTVSTKIASGAATMGACNVEGGVDNGSWMGPVLL